MSKFTTKHVIDVAKQQKDSLGEKSAGKRLKKHWGVATFQ